MKSNKSRYLIEVEGLLNWMHHHQNNLALKVVNQVCPKSVIYCPISVIYCPICYLLSYLLSIVLSDIYGPNCYLLSYLLYIILSVIYSIICCVWYYMFSIIISIIYCLICYILSALSVKSFHVLQSVYMFLESKY